MAAAARAFNLRNLEPEYDAAARRAAAERVIARIPRLGGQEREYSSDAEEESSGDEPDLCVRLGRGGPLSGGTRKRGSWKSSKPRGVQADDAQDGDTAPRGRASGERAG